MSDKPFLIVTCLPPHPHPPTPRQRVAFQAIDQLLNNQFQINFNLAGPTFAKASISFPANTLFQVWRETFP